MRVKDAMKPIVECWKQYSGDDGFEDEHAQFIILSATGSLKKKEREYLRGVLTDDGYQYAMGVIDARLYGNQQQQVQSLFGKLH